MKTLKIGIVIALIVADMAITLWQQARVSRLARENTRLTEQTAKFEPLQKEVERLRNAEPDSAELVEARGEVAQLRSELAKLRGNAGEVYRKKAENARLRTELAKKDAENGTNELTGAMSNLMKDATEQLIQGKLSRMKEKLNLTPDQAKAIEEILTTQATRTVAMTQKLMAGKKVSAEDVPKPGDPGMNAEQQIKDLLSPEQLDAYQDVQKEENINNARMVANSEMMQLQMSVSLAPEQQDKVRDVLYEQSLKQLNGEAAKAILASGTANPANPVDAFQAMVDQKLKALEPVLTPEQLDKYRKLQESQLKYMKSISTLMPGLVPKP